MSRKAKSKNRSKRKARPQPQFRTKGLIRPISKVVSMQDEIMGWRPNPSEGELLEDLAILSNTTRETLQPELRQEAEAVVEALDAVAKGEFDRAISGLAGIARSSLYSDWRLFVRGLVALYQLDTELARQNWSRLDRQRRPARMATTLLLAETDQPLDETMASPDAPIVKRVQSVLQLRDAIASANQIAAVKHRDSETFFSVSQVAMTVNFRDTFAKIATEFVTAFSQACVRLSTFQPHSKTFELLKQAVRGPKNDPNWNLLAFNYYRQFNGAEEVVQEAAERYVTKDLPQLTHLTESVRGALASTIFLKQADSEIRKERSWYGSIFRSESTNYARIERLLNAAIRSYPANRKAHHQLIESYEQQLKYGDEEDSDKTAVKVFLATEAMVEQFGDEAKPMLFLIDYYFEEEQIDKAQKLVQRLAQLRHDDPVVKALPWKLKIREAMFLSRRKGRLAEARRSLAEAETNWPTWLDRRLLSFLVAALEFRAGDKVKFEALNSAARSQCGCVPWVADVMMFAAMQQMNVPGPDLKPHREKILAYAKDAQNLPMDELCSLGAFFWDLNRVGIKHKAYRTQASSFGKSLCARLQNLEKPSEKKVFLETVSWLSLHDFWADERSLLRSWLSGWWTEPKVAAAVLENVLRHRYGAYQIEHLKDLIDLLSSTAKVESDAFYRYRFESIAQKSREMLAACEADASTRGRMFNGDFDDDEYDDDDEEDFFEDELSDEAECNCASCRAERARAALEMDDDEDEYEDDEDDFDSMTDSSVPQFIFDLLLKTGPSGMAELEFLAKKLGNTPDMETRNQLMISFLKRHGVSLADIQKFMENWARPGEGNESSQAMPKNAAQRREFDKKRRNELNKKRRR